jgi:hypothetical protein
MYKEIDEINIQYNGEWVFLINCKKDGNGTVIGGEVAIHSESRDNVIREMQKFMMEESDTYFRYAGEIPEGVRVIL